ncbi:origin recognition complex subunit 5 C-terminus-domain-containing protein [Achaetomium macrosporum]|uniref:Origin recognition complex subunit 5 C-terminus-domain-containing protein n=1 Tax=Achaetomium macrosporum TaxID=79813 RepID=A0AAN7CC18_9PEZI|nr:origin recognition complex subunit 5 C-terminus-domain-containing protein [Achaetomium macrosporum]
MSSSLFQLPDELLMTTLAQAFPSRETQIRALATLLCPGAAPCRNLVIYGTEATGKSAITAALLARLSDQPGDDGFSLRYAIANSIECITARHLYETVVGKVASALEWPGAPSRCETVSQLAVELSKMLKYTPRPDGFRFVLVFDAIDRQRDAPHTLLPALARLSEIIPSLTTVFIVTSPAPYFLRISSVPHLHFPTYTKPEFISILSTTPPPPLPNTTPSETADLWARFTAAVHDALARAASRTLPSFRHACTALWPRFTAPIHAGTHTSREFSKLLVAARMHFQDESLLDPGVLAVSPQPGNNKSTTNTTNTTGSIVLHKQGRAGIGAGARAGSDLATLLPTIPRLILLASYLASHNATRHDLTLFSTHHHGRRHRGGGGLSSRGGGQRSKHRKIARKLLGAHAFVLERMLAIFAAVRGEWETRAAASTTGTGRKGGRWEEKGEKGDADIGMAIATLASLRLLVRVGGAGDPMDCGGKWRVNVGWEVIRGLGRAVGVEVEEWLID